VRALLRTGKRVVTARQSSTPASACLLCEPLGRENEKLRKQVEKLRKQNEI